MAMRIQSVTPALGGNRPHSATAAAHVVDSQIDALAYTDDVLLHQDASLEPNSALGLETLLAVIQGILKQIETTPLNIADAIHTNTQLLDPDTLPAWLISAERLRTHPQTPTTQLCAIGTLTLEQGTALPFVLDMQLLQAPVTCPPDGMVGSFRLGLGAGSAAGAQIDFTLNQIGQTGMSDRRSQAGTPLFAQFAFGWQPDILCIAARLLPASPVNVVPPHPMHAGDGSYVTMEEPVGRTHLLDVSA
jgi:hypothetical protein